MFQKISTHAAQESRSVFLHLAGHKCHNITHQ